jgi:hypothetical protein
MKLSDWLTDPLSNIYFFSSVFLHKLNVLSIDQQADSTKKQGLIYAFIRISRSLPTALIEWGFAVLQA